MSARGRAVAVAAESWTTEHTETEAVMKSEGEFGGAARALLDRDEVEGVLSGAFYAPMEESRRRRPAAVASLPGEGRKEADKPLHYKVICISMYTDDLTRLDQMVEALKARGLTKANRSALIRHALSGVDLSKVPRGM